MTSKTEQELNSRFSTAAKPGTPVTVWRCKKNVQRFSSGCGVWNDVDTQYVKTMQDMLILKLQGYTIETITEIL